MDRKKLRPVKRQWPPLKCEVCKMETASRFLPDGTMAGSDCLFKMERGLLQPRTPIKRTRFKNKKRRRVVY